MFLLSKHAFYSIQLLKVYKIDKDQTGFTNENGLNDPRKTKYLTEDRLLRLF